MPKVIDYDYEITNEYVELYEQYYEAGELPNDDKEVNNECESC